MEADVRLFGRLAGFLGDALGVRIAGAITHGTAALERMTGRTAVTVADVHPDDRARFASGAEEMEYRVLRPDGTARWIRERSFPTEGTGRAAILEDITERRTRSVERERAQTMEALRQLAGAIAHDINNDLTVIASSAEDLVAETPDDERLQDLRVAGESLVQRTRELAAFARQNAAADVRVDVNVAVDDVESRLRQVLGTTTDLEIDRGAEVGKARIDPAHAALVLEGLVVMAKPEAGGRVALRTRRTDVVEDNLTGPSPGAYVRIEVESSRAPEAEPDAAWRGGLGLLLGLVERSGGHVEAVQRRGSVAIRAYVPRARATVPPRSASSRSSVAPPLA